MDGDGPTDESAHHHVHHTIVWSEFELNYSSKWLAFLMINTVCLQDPCKIAWFCWGRVKDPHSYGTPTHSIVRRKEKREKWIRKVTQITQQITILILRSNVRWQAAVAGGDESRAIRSSGGKRSTLSSFIQMDLISPYIYFLLSCLTCQEFEQSSLTFVGLVDRSWSFNWVLNRFKNPYRRWFGVLLTVMKSGNRG